MTKITQELDKSLAEAMSHSAVRSWIDHQLGTTDLAGWLNEGGAALGQFLTVATLLEAEEAARLLAPERLEVLRLYRNAMAASPRRAEPISFAMSRAIGAEPCPDPTLRKQAARAVLEMSLPRRGPFVDKGHRAILGHSLVQAVIDPDMTKITVAFLGEYPDLPSDPRLLATLAVAAGPRLIELVAEAILADPEHAEELTNRLRDILRWDVGTADPTTIARDVLTWYRENSGDLDFDPGAAYPAPPDRPLFRPREENICPDPACQQSNPTRGRFCNRCGAVLKPKS